MAKNNVTIVSTTALTTATEIGFGKKPVAFDLQAAQAPIRVQWEEAVGAISDTFFTETGSARCVLEELELAVELKVEGGFRFMLSGNLAATGSIRAKFRRKD